MVRRVAAAAAAVVLSMALVACSDGEEPEAPRPSQVSMSTPTAPTSSAAAEPRLGPVQTVRAWFEALSESMLSGDTAAVRALSSAGCNECSDRVESIEETFNAGGSWELDGPGWEVVSAKIFSRTGPDAVVYVALKLSGGRLTPSDGATPGPRYPADQRIEEARLTRVDGKWLVLFLGVIE